MEADPLRRDFRNFLFKIWQHLLLPEPTPVQYDMALYLQHGPKKKMLQAFRGVGKSWITSAYVLWRLYCDPQLKVLVVSASKDRANEFSTFTKQLIDEIEWLMYLAPVGEQRDSKISFDVGPSLAAHAPSVKSLGVTGQLTGSRAGLIIADDVEVRNNSLTQVMRDKLVENTKEFSSILTSEEESEIVYLGTPQSEQTVYKGLPERGFAVRVWPARVPDEEQRKEYEEYLCPNIAARTDAGAPTDPKRFSNENLIGRELDKGKAAFAMQFMLLTSLSDEERYPLKLRDLLVMGLNRETGPSKVVWGNQPEHVANDLPMVGMPGDRLFRPAFIGEEYADYTGAIMFIDPAGRGKDETGYAVVKMLNNMLFATALGGIAGGYDRDTLLKLAGVAKEQAVKKIVIESNFGDGMFTALLKPILSELDYNVTLDEIRHTTQKEARICDILEPVMNSHRLVIDDQLIKNDISRTPETEYQLFFQMTRITRDRGCLGHDDRLEALASCVQCFTSQLTGRPQESEKKAKEAWLDKELRKIEDHHLGRKRRKPNWIKNKRFN